MAGYLHKYTTEFDRQFVEPTDVSVLRI